MNKLMSKILSSVSADGAIPLWTVLSLCICLLLAIVVILLIILLKSKSRKCKSLEADNFLNKSPIAAFQKARETTKSILKGLEKGEFKMYLQFIVDNKTKEIVSAEALSRWESPEKGLVFPGEYIVAMEDSGLISKHDFQMFEQVCRQLESWKGTPFETITLSCNFTRITLSEESFINTIESIAEKFDFDRAMLAIEITENAIEKNFDIATSNVIRCKELGFKVYLDDLGNGYTSLSNLCDYPIDVVKIDRDILLKAETEKGKALFGGIIALAHSINIKVICEGVETENQNDLLGASECDFIQGWYYSKAIPLEECESFVNMYKKA